MPMSANGTKSIDSNAKSRAGTGSTTQSRTGNGKMSSSSSQSGGMRSSASQGSQSRDNGMRGPVGANAPSRSQGTQSNTQPSFSKMNNGSQSGMGFNAPTGLSRMPAGPQYNGPARYNQPFNANRSQQIFGGYPNSMSGMMPGQINGFVSAPAPKAQIPAGQRVTDVFGPTVRMDPGIIAAMNPPASPPPGQRVTDYFSQPTALDPSIRGRVQPKPTRVAAGEKVSAVFGPSYAQDPSLAGRLNVPAPANNVPIPQQNPLSDPSKFTYNANRDRDYVFGGTDQSAVSRLVSMQEKYGSPLRITSGYRSPALNAKVGGAKASQHLQGNAFDVHTDNPNKSDYARLAQAAADSGFSGLGAYRPGSLHVDTGPQRSWGASKGPVMAAVNAPRVTMASSAPPPKNTLVRAIAPAVKSGLGALKNMIAPSNIPRPQPKPGMPSINPAGWADLPGAGMVKAAYNAVDENIVQPVQDKIEQYGGFEKAGNLARMVLALDGKGAPTGSGGKGGLNRLPRGAKPTPVEGPTPPAPGFTWVQWFPGSPPTQIPTNALIGAA